MVNPLNIAIPSSSIYVNTWSESSDHKIEAKRPLGSWTRETTILCLSLKISNNIITKNSCKNHRLSYKTIIERKSLPKKRNSSDNRTIVKIQQKQGLGINSNNLEMFKQKERRTDCKLESVAGKPTYKKRRMEEQNVDREKLKKPLKNISILHRKFYY